MTKSIHSLNCPYCGGKTQITAVHCRPCSAEIRAEFQANEFADLDKDDLHFLRIFLQFEGRIRDMEAPLGLSYPTIRTRLVALKEKVKSGPAPSAAGPSRSILDDLAEGKTSFEETLKEIKNRKKERK